MYPTGEAETVFKGKWNFDWQVGYQLAKPMRLPKGTRILAIAHYDNSANNKFNPDPAQDDPVGRSELGRDAVGIPRPGVRRQYRREQSVQVLGAEPDAARHDPVRRWPPTKRRWRKSSYALRSDSSSPMRLSRIST